MAKALFISRNDLVNKTPLGGNVDADKILPFVEVAQETHIQSLLGTDLYDKISADIVAGNLTGDYLNLVNTYVKPVLVHYAIVDYLAFAPFTIGNGGVYKHQSENSQPVTEGEMAYLMENQRKTAKSYAERLIDHLQYNASTKYPEYYTNSNEDIDPIRDENFSSWVL